MYLLKLSFWFIWIGLFRFNLAIEDYISAFECKLPGSAILSLRTNYYAVKHRRIWKFQCSKLHKTSSGEKCTYFSSSRTFDGLTAECPMENGYLTGMGKWTMNKSNFTVYRFKCCAHSDREIIKQSCFTSLLVEKRKSAGLRLSNEDGVITKLRADYDPNVDDNTWFITVCNFEDQLPLKRGVYYKFPSSQSDNYGNRHKNYEFRQQCSQGKAVVRIDSLFGYTNKDRIMFVSCQYINDSKIACAKTTIRKPELITGEQNYSAPINWSKEGCRTQEVLVSISSSFHDGVRRYAFGCCQLSKFYIDDATCHWENASSARDSDWSFKAPFGQIFRGIAATFSESDRDRSEVSLELCSLSDPVPQSAISTTTGSMESTPETAEETWALCRMLLVPYVPQVVHAKSYSKSTVAFIDECAIKCNMNPFCKSFYYRRTGKCYLTYMEANCTSDQEMKPFASSELEIVWVMCFEC